MTIALEPVILPGTGSTGDPAEYPMRSWVFDETLGRFDIDLGDSHAQCSTLESLDLPAGLELNYGVDRGTPELARQIARRYDGRAERVVVTHGAQEALYLLYSTLLSPGDRVVAFRPGWQHSWHAPRYLGCEVVLLDLAPDFSLDLDALERAAADGMKLITLNSPCNPTGRRLRPDELDAVLRIAARTGAHVVLDEEYVLDLTASPAVADDRLISVSSLSKTAGLPGLRIGWMYAPPAIAAACAAYKHLTSVSNSVLCEALAAGVLARWETYAERYLGLISHGLDQVEQLAARHPGKLRLVPPQGTPFAWLVLTTGESSLSFARRVLEARVLIMPGETLGAGGGIRICFAREPDALTEGLARIEAVLTTPHTARENTARENTAHENGDA
jgi:aspartate/methionine/tyrosine aminotransferase